MNNGWIEKRAWELRDGIRDDLLLFDYALEHGFKAWGNQIVAGLPYECIQYVRTTGGLFEEGSTHLWRYIIKTKQGYGNEWSEFEEGWTAATLIDGKYQNHRKYDTLKEAIDNESV